MHRKDSFWLVDVTDTLESRLLSDNGSSYVSRDLAELLKYIEASGIPQKCTYEVGGIRFKLESVSFWDYDLAETFGGNGFMRLTSLVKYSIEDSQSGVFEPLYKLKYSTDQQGRTCSKYTCISFEDWWREMIPTWHTQSIMLNGRDQAGPTNSRFNNSEF